MAWKLPRAIVARLMDAMTAHVRAKVTSDRTKAA